MKQLFVIKDTLENKITYCHLAAFLVLLPFDRFYTEIILISLLLHTVIHLNRSRLRSVLATKNLILSSVLLLNIAGLIYSADKKEGFKDIERQLAILLCPLIFSMSGHKRMASW